MQLKTPDAAESKQESHEHLYFEIFEEEKKN